MRSEPAGLANFQSHDASTRILTLRDQLLASDRTVAYLASHAGDLRWEYLAGTAQSAQFIRRLIEQIHLGKPDNGVGPGVKLNQLFNHSDKRVGEAAMMNTPWRYLAGGAVASGLHTKLMAQAASQLAGNKAAVDVFWSLAANWDEDAQSLLDVVASSV